MAQTAPARNPSPRPPERRFIRPGPSARAQSYTRRGLPRQKALTYAAKMAEGTAKLMLETNQHPGVMKDAVCSPAGSTIAGVRALEEHGFRAAAMDAVIAAMERNRELGK